MTTVDSVSVTPLRKTVMVKVPAEKAFDVFTNGGCIGGSPAGVDPHVAANAPTQTLQLL